jgi:hypothetical protein
MLSTFLQISAILETREVLNPAFIHPSRKNSRVITKVILQNESSSKQAEFEY